MSRSKGNQAMKFGQFIEHSMRNILKNISKHFEKPYIKCDGDTILKNLFQKIKIEHISGQIF